MKILVLCSGGDAPGMNRFIYTLSKNFEDVYYAYKGFKGLVEGDIRTLDKTEIERFLELMNGNSDMYWGDGGLFTVTG